MDNNNTLTGHNRLTTQRLKYSKENEHIHVTDHCLWWLTCTVSTARSWSVCPVGVVLCLYSFGFTRVLLSFVSLPAHARLCTCSPFSSVLSSSRHLIWNTWCLSPTIFVHLSLILLISTCVYNPVSVFCCKFIPVASVLPVWSVVTSFVFRFWFLACLFVCFLVFTFFDYTTKADFVPLPCLPGLTPACTRDNSVPFGE